MKILILSHEYPPYIFGGVAYYTKELAEYLALQGFTVYIASSFFGKLQLEHRNKIKVYRVKIPNIPIRSFWFSLKSRSLVSKLVELVDCIIFNAGSAGFLPLQLRRKIKAKKLISIFHGTPYSLISYFAYISFSDKLRYAEPMDALYYIIFLPVSTELNRQELIDSDYTIAVAQHVIKELAHIYPELKERIYSKSCVVYGGIDCEHLSSIRGIREGFRDGNCGRKVYAYVGRLHLVKGVHHALRAFKLIQEELGKDTELWIFGKGPLERPMKIYAKKNNLNVKFFGFISREKLLKLLVSNVSALIFPSLYEGCPLTLIEANALGIPAVVWDLPWSREFVIQGINGYRTKPFIVEELAKQVIKVSSLSPENIHKSALRFDKKDAFTKLKQLLESCIY